MDDRPKDGDPQAPPDAAPTAWPAAQSPWASQEPAPPSPWAVPEPTPPPPGAPPEPEVLSPWSPPAAAEDAAGSPSVDPVDPVPPDASGAPGAPVDWQAAGGAAPTSGRKKVVYIGLAVAVVVLFGLIRSIMGGSTSNDPYDVATREVGQKLLEMPEFKAKYGDITSEERAYEIGQKIALSGIPRLGDADLLRYWQLTNKMIGVADPAICGRIFKQTAGTEDARKTARALDLESFKQLLDVTLLAFQADLRGDPVRPAPSNEALTTAFAALQTSMGAGMVDTAAKLSDKSASDADVCAAGRSFLGAVLSLGEPDRTVIARYMISAAAAP